MENSKCIGCGLLPRLIQIQIAPNGSGITVRRGENAPKENENEYN